MKMSYYYINAYLEVRYAINNGWPADEDLRKSGNYFSTKEEADEVAKEFRKIIEKHKHHEN